jgi:hypothetical protein
MLRRKKLENGSIFFDSSPSRPTNKIKQLQGFSCARLIEICALMIGTRNEPSLQVNLCDRTNSLHDHGAHLLCGAGGFDAC